MERSAVFGEIVLRRLDESSEDVHMAPTDIRREWLFAFPSLPPGAYSASVRYACTGGDVRFTIDRIVVSPGENTLDVRPTE